MRCRTSAARVRWRRGFPGITPFLVPLNLETLQIIWPTALSVAFVGLLETLLTAKLVDDLTDTRSNKGRESWALGVANIAAGFYGGIAGCAMIGQTVVNVKIGRARTRVSTVVAALVLLLLVTGLSDLMAQIPMVALAAVMMIVAIKTVNWHSVQPATLKRMPIPETMVMAVTVAITVATGNLALGVAAGVLLAMVLFARRVAHVIRAERTLSHDGLSVRYDVHGPLFFGSSNDLVGALLLRRSIRSGSPSISPIPRSGMPRASRRWIRSKPNTANAAPLFRLPGSTSAARPFTSACRASSGMIVACGARALDREFLNNARRNICVDLSQPHSLNFCGASRPRV